MNKLIINEIYKNMLFDIFNSYCPDAEIWAYGSRLTGNAHDGSDLDLVVKSFNQQEKYLYELQNLIRLNNIPFLVDINEYDKLPQSFQKEIDKNYVVFYKKIS